MEGTFKLIIKSRINAIIFIIFNFNIGIMLNIYCICYAYIESITRSVHGILL
jgi:hypothetical protein